MICIPIVAKTERDALSGLGRAEKITDLIKLRLDLPLGRSRRRLKTLMNYGVRSIG